MFFFEKKNQKAFAPESMGKFAKVFCFFSSEKKSLLTSGREFPARPLVGIGIIVFRHQEASLQVLLIRRGRPPGAGAWSLPGGAQRLGETMEQAARRELAEETGLTVGALHLAAVVDSIHHDSAGAVQYHYTIIDFAALWQAGEPVAGGDAPAAIWAAEADFDRLELWHEARRAIAAGRVTLGLPPP